MTGSSIYYWDSCVFLALLKKEQQHGSDEWAAIEHMALDFDRGICKLATSTISLLEVLSANLTEEQKQTFEGVLQRSNFVLMEASEPIMREAAKIRRYYHGKVLDGEGKSLIVSSPDAIHVASAILVEAEEMITLDIKNKPNRREMGLLQLGGYGKVLGKFAMPIRKPSYGRSGSLFYDDKGRQTPESPPDRMKAPPDR